MNSFFALLLLGMASLSLKAQNQQHTFREELYFDSFVLSNRIPIQVYLPVDYEMNMEKYQVHYIFDGILTARMYAGMADHYSQLNLIPEIIVVGLNHNRRYKHDKYKEFLEEELIPFIDSTYRTVPFRLLAGHSSSGEQALYTLFEGSELMQGYISGSPTGLEKFDIQNVKYDTSQLKFIYTAIAENDFKDIVNQYPGFLLRIKELSRQVPFYTEIISDKSHYTCFPVMINNALLKLFEGWMLSFPEGQNEEVIPLIEAHYQLLSNRFGYHIVMPEKTIYRMAYQWIHVIEDYSNAIELLEYAVELYPTSGFLYHLLAKGYHRTDQYDLAEIHYQKAIELVPPDYKMAMDDYEKLKRDRK